MRNIVRCWLMRWTLIGFLIGLHLFFPLPGLADGQARVRVDPLTIDVGVDQTAGVQIVVEDVQALYGYELHLTFDSQIIEVVDADPERPDTQVRPGEFLSVDLVAVNRVDNEFGLVDFAMTQLNPSEAVSGSGVLLSFVIRGKKATEASPLTLELVKLATRDGELIPVLKQNGTVRVVPEEQSPPTPTAAPSPPRPTVEIPTPTPTREGAPPPATATFTPMPPTATPGRTQSPPTRTFTPSAPSPTASGPTATPVPVTATSTPAPKPTLLTATAAPAEPERSPIPPEATGEPTAVPTATPQPMATPRTPETTAVVHRAEPTAVPPTEARPAQAPAPPEAPSTSWVQANLIPLVVAAAAVLLALVLLFGQERRGRR